MSKSQQLIERLLPFARKRLESHLQQRTNKIWGPTDAVVFRVRKYKFGDETVGLIKPNYHQVKLYSKTLQRMVPLEMTQQTLRHIESMGGLDEYVTRTRHSELRSRPASDLKWQISCILAERQRQQRQQQAGRAPSQQQQQEDCTAPGLQPGASTGGASTAAWRRALDPGSGVKASTQMPPLSAGPAGAQEEPHGGVGPVPGDAVSPAGLAHLPRDKRPPPGTKAEATRVKLAASASPRSPTAAAAAGQ